MPHAPQPAQTTLGDNDLLDMKMNLKPLNIDCAVPDCEDKAVTVANISINSAPKKRLPVCRCHADAAEEDSVPVTDPQHSDHAS